MTKNLRRMFTAFILSAACFYAVEYWYQTLDLGLKITSRQESVARLIRHNNEVQRKPVTRLIWEVVSNNENLFPGEAIRTTASSDATILFLKSGTTVELEPDSQVIIQGDSNEISLNFVKGNLFVKQDEGAQNEGSITLKTANGEIDIKKANLSLAQTEKGVDLEVYSGNAKLTKDGKTVEVDSTTAKSEFFKLISPLPHLPAFISPESKEPVVFQWKKLPAGYNVYIERGENRNQLSRVDGYFAPGEQGEIKLQTKTGKLYWRAVAVPNDPKAEIQYSKTIYTQVIAKAPPTLLQPEENQTLVLSDSKKITYKWTTRSKATQKLILEVATDPSLKNKVLQKNLGDNLTFLTIPVDKPGDYYWRITGFMKIREKLEPVSSSVQKYTVSFNAPLVPPIPKSPANNQQFGFQQISQKGVYFSWQPVSGINKYKVTLRYEKKFEDGTVKPVEATKESSTALLKWENLEPGAYSYFISSLNDQDETSKPSELRNFRIGEIPKIEWTTGSEKTRYQYVTATPSVSISWKNSIDNVAKWKIRYAKTDDFIETAEWVDSPTNIFKSPLSESGSWNFQVKASDQDDNLLAQSDIKAILVIERPLLRAPAFAPQMANPIASNRRGTLNVQWNKIQEAQSYYIQLTNEDGEVIRNQTSKVNETAFRGLAPGNYKISVKSVDQYDRPGPSGELRDVVVPDGSNIAAPKLKKIDVK